MLTVAQVRAQVAAIRKRMANGARAFAIHMQGAWTGPETIEVAGVQHRVFPCESDLQVREALLRSESEEEPCILLCQFPTDRIGDDVIARLAKRRVFPPQTGEVLAELFGARVIDARVLATKPLVDALINRAPQDGYKPVSGGSLDLQTAWLALIERVFDERWDAPSLTGILRWSRDEQRLRAYAELDQPLRQVMTDWLAQTAGQAARFVLAALSNRTGDLVQLGLLLDLLWQPECRGLPETQVAQGRLERYYGNREIDEASAKAWALAAGEILCQEARVDLSTVRPALVALDRLIDEMRVTDLALHSRFSSRGLEAQFESLGHALSSALAAPSSAALPDVATVLCRAKSHFLIKEHEARLHRVRMALRLVSWLQVSEPPAKEAGFSELAEYYLREGGFVDWARDCLAESDPATSLRAAYREILRRVEERFVAFESAFVASTQRWFADGSPSGLVLPVEEVLHSVAGPAARQQPVLLLVLDGMSVAAFRQLLDDLVRRDWVELGHRGFGIPRPGVATSPTVTEVSRWALLAGRLDANRRSTERTEFSGNIQLAELAGGQARPQLFVKSDLSSGEQLGLAPPVYAAIQNPKCRLVVVVVNAMDDLLAASDQVALTWGMDSIRPLRELLHAARESGRIVLITSDHGHVLDTGTEQRRSEGGDTGDRYRAPTGVLAEGEVEVSGRRVEQAFGRSSVVCLARRNLRYQAKKRGYHGGLCVQEVIIPVAALRHAACSVGVGWEDLPPFQPEWWSAESLVGMEASLPRPRFVSPATLPETKRAELDLFAHAAQRLGQPEPDWLLLLLGSPLYREQAKRVARGAPPVELMQKLLKALEARGGTMLRGALAQELGLPLFRIDGLVQSAGRILNLDGYEVIEYDRASETVFLRISLLKRQFEIE